jgi:hypothetical protein
MMIRLHKLSHAGSSLALLASLRRGSAVDRWTSREQLQERVYFILSSAHHPRRLPLWVITATQVVEGTTLGKAGVTRSPRCAFVHSRKLFPIFSHIFCVHSWSQLIINGWNDSDDDDQLSKTILTENTVKTSILPKASLGLIFAVS